MVNFKENYHFSRFWRGSNIFQGGPFFSRGGVQLLIPYSNPYNLWFSRGGPDPLSPPLDPHLCDFINFKGSFGITDHYIGIYNQNLLSYFQNQNICCGYSKEQSQWDSSFELLKHMSKLVDEKKYLQFFFQKMFFYYKYRTLECINVLTLNQLQTFFIFYQLITRNTSAEKMSSGTRVFRAITARWRMIRKKLISLQRGFQNQYG